MDLLEANTQSFILKLWVEEKGKSIKNRRRHGHITHIASGDHLHFDSLEKLETFLGRYLKGKEKGTASDWMPNWLDSQNICIDK